MNAFDKEESVMTGDSGLFNEIVRFQVIEAYLYDAKSHRRIQEDILKMPAPARGGGFITMQVLHEYGIGGDKKGYLIGKVLREELESQLAVLEVRLS